MTLVVILTVRTAALDQFRTFEAEAARVMAKHGGAIERTVAISSEPGDELVKEVHIVTFPDREAMRAYQRDAELRGAAHLREASVVHTETLVGEDGPDYSPDRTPG